MTTQFPIKYLILEGPDCCGKTTLYKSIHKLTNFRYNIQDRSALSMLCYARQYNRNVDLKRQFLKEELSDLNKFFVVLLPSEEVLLDRLAFRGDEFQNATSVVTLRKLFAEEVDKIQHMPNVLVIRNIASADQLAEYVGHKLRSYEKSTPVEVGAMTSSWVSGINFTEEQLNFKLCIDPTYADPEILNNPHEGDYYKSILNKCCAIIQDEIDGKNPYSKSQDLLSRRFYYSSDSCISSIHFMPRDGDLKVLCTLRSTDVRKNGSIDTCFLAHLSTHVSKTFSWPVKNIQLYVNLNSAHVR
jgi:thymidylate kinase